MSFGAAVKHVFANYANFNGRAGRPEFWWFYLFHGIVSLIIYAIYLVGLFTSPTKEISPGVVETDGFGPLAILGVILFFVWGIGTILPVIAVSVRRLHDGDRSGWWFLLNFICFGGIVLLIFYILPGTTGPNRYGDGPATA